MSPLAYIVAVLLACIGCTGIGWRAGIEHIKAQQADADQVRHQTIEDAQRGAALAISQLEIKHVTIRQTVETRTRDVPVYRECRHAPGMLVDINEALTGQQPEPAGDGQLPTASAPTR